MSLRFFRFNYYVALLISSPPSDDANGEPTTILKIVIPSVALVIILVILLNCFLCFVAYKCKKNHMDTSREDQHHSSSNNSFIPSHQSAATYSLALTEAANHDEPEYVSITALQQETTYTDSTHMTYNISYVSDNCVNVHTTHNKAYGIFATAINDRTSLDAGAVSNHQETVTSEEEYYEHYY